MDVSSKYSLLIHVCTKKPQEEWNAFCGSWNGVFGPPLSIQMDKSGEWKNESWAELRSERRIKLLFQGVGAHPWVLERRNGLARGICTRLKEGDLLSGKQILAVVDWRLNSLVPGGGFSAYQMVFGSNPADRYGWNDKDEDLTFAQDT